MKRLSGVDAAFLQLETRSSHMQVMATIVLEPPEPHTFTAETVRAVMAERLDRLPELHHRLVPVVFGLQRPVWVDDQPVDLDYHVVDAWLAEPAHLGQLARYTAEQAGTKLDPYRPLWRMWVVHGLAEGRVALVAKFHHALIDGENAVELMANLFDFEPLAPTARHGDATAHPPADTTPSAGELGAAEVATLADLPGATVRVAGTIARAITRQARSRMRGGPPLTLVFSGPRTRFNRALTASRVVSFADLELARVKALKKRFGVTVNDVVVATVSGALRRYLLDRHELPPRDLVAAIPASAHSAVEGGRLGNRLSALFSTLPVTEGDPIARVRSVADHTAAAKADQQNWGPGLLSEVCEVSPWMVVGPVLEAYSRFRVADRHRPPCNVILSNFAGPPVPLYLGGARLRDAYMMGPIFDGVGLNVTVMSNCDTVGVALTATPETAPDLDDLAKLIPWALEELELAADLVDEAEAIDTGSFPHPGDTPLASAPLADAPLADTRPSSQSA